MFLEHKVLYLSERGFVPREPYAIPIRQPDIRRAGSDVTVVATQAMVAKALSTAAVLQQEGISVEVIDPCTIRPLDEETILASVCKTRRLVVAHEACLSGGFGAEVAARITERAFKDLHAPVSRVTARDTPMPFNDTLETHPDAPIP